MTSASGSGGAGGLRLVSSMFATGSASVTSVESSLAREMIATEPTVVRLATDDARITLTFAERCTTRGPTEAHEVVTF